MSSLCVLGATRSRVRDLSDLASASAVVTRISLMPVARNKSRTHTPTQSTSRNVDTTGTQCDATRVQDELGQGKGRLQKTAAVLQVAAFLRPVLGDGHQVAIPFQMAQQHGLVGVAIMHFHHLGMCHGLFQLGNGHALLAFFEYAQLLFYLAQKKH